MLGREIKEMSKRLAMTTDGRMTYCSASDAKYWQR